MGRLSALRGAHGQAGRGEPALAGEEEGEIAMERLTLGEVMGRALRRSVKTVGVMVPVDGDGQPVCPVCAERRRKDAERVKRWREKRK